MQHSNERILTTHTGSLPRPASIVALVEGYDQRELRANPAFDVEVSKAVAEIVRKQSEIGIDILNDGEMSKRGFSHYVTERVTGFDGPSRAMPLSIEASMFPEYYESTGPGDPGHACCNGTIAWCGDEHVQRDIANLQAALREVSPADVFMPAVSPGQVCHNFVDEYYRTEEAYVFAIAKALSHEYRAIVDAGFVLQLDSPHLALTWNSPEFAGKTFSDYRKFVELHVEAINSAIEGVPANRVRLHLCWGNNERPHVRDVPIAEIIDVVYGAKVGAISFEGANPRHGHEWKVFKDHPLPDDKIIIPGVIDTLTNFVEHPELVSERIQRYAGIVGKERVIAGTDCGFSSRVRSKLRVHPTVVWAKLQALVEGARLASKQLWP